MGTYHELLQQLASPVPKVRDGARLGLVQAGKAAIPVLVQGLGSPERDIRAQSALCIGAMGFKGAIRVLMAMVDGDPDPSVRPLALRALVDLTSSDASEELRALLLRQASSSDMFARALACQALGRVGDDPSRQALQRALSDTESWVREAAHRAMSEATPTTDPSASPDPSVAPAPSRALVPTTPADDVHRLLAQLGSPDLQQQAEAQRRLLEHGATAVGGLLQLLYNELSPARRAALEILGGIGGPVVVQGLVALLDQPSASGLLAPLLHALARAVDQTTGDSVPGPGLRRLLKTHSDEMVRAAAARVLISAGSINRRLGLQLALADDEEWVRLTALATLAQQAETTDHEILPLLTSHLERCAGGAGVDPSVPLHLLQALDRILQGEDPGPLAAGALRGAGYFLHDDDPAIRLAAAQVLIHTASPRDIDDATLTGLLDLLDEDPGPRMDLIRALGRLARPTSTLAVDTLARLLRQANTTEAREAARSLVTIGGRRAIDALVQVANSRQGAVASVATQALAAVDPRAAAVGVRGPDGVWEARTQHFCPCGATLGWVLRQQTTGPSPREELRCSSCDREYVLSVDGKLVAVDATPFGTCLCPECRRRQVLLRRPGQEALFCRVSGRVHVRPFDHPHQLRLLSDLPLGVCGCCAEPQPLIRVDQEVVCYRSREHHRATPTGFVLRATVELASAQDQVAAINEALLAGSIGVGESGIATASVLGHDDDEG